MQALASQYSAARPSGFPNPAVGRSFAAGGTTYRTKYRQHGGDALWFAAAGRVRRGAVWLELFPRPPRRPRTTTGRTWSLRLRPRRNRDALVAKEEKKNTFSEPHRASPNIDYEPGAVLPLPGT
ncbi:hypothetical protein VDGL01_01057 [Verticillium dahliae]